MTSFKTYIIPARHHWLKSIHFVQEGTLFPQNLDGRCKQLVLPSIILDGCVYFLLFGALQARELAVTSGNADDWMLRPDSIRVLRKFS